MLGSVGMRRVLLLLPLCALMFLGAAFAAAAPQSPPDIVDCVRTPGEALPPLVLVPGQMLRNSWEAGPHAMYRV